MLNVVIGIACLICAALAIREKRLLVAVLWLALTSALVSWMMYRLGASETAVIELSVGAGLVTVLFVFAVNIIGDEEVPDVSLIPKPLAWALVVTGGVLIVWMAFPHLQLEALSSALSIPPQTYARFQQVLWGERAMDTLLQIVLIFAGVMAILGLLSVRNHPGGESQ